MHEMGMNDNHVIKPKFEPQLRKVIDAQQVLRKYTQQRSCVDHKRSYPMVLRGGLRNGIRSSTECKGLYAFSCIHTYKIMGVRIWSSKVFISVRFITVT